MTTVGGGDLLNGVQTPRMAWPLDDRRIAVQARLEASKMQSPLRTDKYNNEDIVIGKGDSQF